MKCPNCGAEAPAGAVDCAGCGVIFAKFKAKLERVEAPAPAPPVNRWKGRAIALTLVMLWCAGFALYYSRVVADLRARKPDRPPVAR